MGMVSGAGRGVRQVVVWGRNSRHYTCKRGGRMGDEMRGTAGQSFLAVVRGGYGLRRPRDPAP